MPRILKDPEVRKNEIMDTAWELFNSKGYEKTSVLDILEKAGIAKGTLYYYFKSKEEILDAVINRTLDEGAARLEVIISGNSMNAVEKIKAVVLNGLKETESEEHVLEYLHREENSIMHLKLLVQTIYKFTPVISKIIDQGIEEGLFKTRYPVQVTEFVMVISSFLLDPSIFPWSKEQYMLKLKALEDMLETMLRCGEGTFGFMSEVIEGNIF